jgi:hypothetical protein
LKNVVEKVFEKIYSDIGGIGFVCNIVSFLGHSLKNVAILSLNKKVLLVVPFSIWGLILRFWL